MAVQKSRKSIIKKKNKLNYKLKNYKFLKNIKLYSNNYILDKQINYSNNKFFNL